MPASVYKFPSGHIHADTPIELVSHARVVESIRMIGADAWNACFAGEVEDYHYLLAVEESDIAGFEWRYAVIENQGRVVAAMPGFVKEYPLDTTLDNGPLRRAIRRLRCWFPGFLTMKLACLGSPATECGLVGFHASVIESRQQGLMAQLLSGFEHHARRCGAKLVGIKDVPMQQKALWEAAARGYSAISGLPTAHLDIDFASIDGYLARLSHASRKDMRRKLKNARHIRIEERANIDDVLPEVLALYRDTKARSEFQFEELTAAYFQNVLAQLPGRAMCMLYWQGSTLLAANLMLKDGKTLLDKFFCMEGARGREYNLYYVSWFHNLRYCLEHGIPHYQSGQACYGNKLRLKSRLQPNEMLFRHVNPFINALLKQVAQLLAMGEPNDQ